ncbi:hypothetical protein [Rhizobium sp.]|uniref:hypothetical protein n=1 Tax=Rhizobium sp. TaxID=391 RepID=UPI003F7E219A
MEVVVPLFRYTLKLGNETKTVELRKSNPQGWLFEAVRSSYPEIFSRRADDIMRLGLEKDVQAKQAWHAICADSPHDLHIHVMQLKR